MLYTAPTLGISGLVILAILKIIQCYYLYQSTQSVEFD